VLYAGYELRTESSQLQVKFDNAKVRVPSYQGRSLVQEYGSIFQMFVHEAWVGGPELCVLNIAWYTNVGTSPVSGNPLVRRPLARQTDAAAGYKLVQQQLYSYTIFCFAGWSRSATATRYQSHCGPTIRSSSWMLTTRSATVLKLLIGTRTRTLNRVLRFFTNIIKQCLKVVLRMLVVVLRMIVIVLRMLVVVLRMIVVVLRMLVVVLRIYWFLLKSEFIRNE
jgi:hypothetical protein